jgi:hypothetical protein
LEEAEFVYLDVAGVADVADGVAVAEDGYSLSPASK